MAFALVLLEGRSLGFESHLAHICRMGHTFEFKGGFPGGSDTKVSACNTDNPSLTPGLGRSLEKGMAASSSILAWRIPWTEELDGLQSMGSHRVGHAWSD